MMRGEAEHAEDVVDVGADDIAERDIGAAFGGGGERRDQFRQRGADRDDGQPITVSDMPASRAKVTAPCTSKSAPNTSSAMPPMANASETNRLGGAGS